MKRTPAKRSSLFLLELIIAILFFSLTSAVCVQIFVRAHLISRQTLEQNMALEKISGFTEVFLAGDSIQDLPGVTSDTSADSSSSSENTAAVADTYNSTSSDVSEYVIYYDADWKICNPGEASYRILIQIEPQGTLQHGTFSAVRVGTDHTINSDPIIYSVETDFCPAPKKEASYS